MLDDTRHLSWWSWSSLFLQVVPGEASVYFQMGKLYKRLDNLGAAQLALETALSLHTTSADAGAIKAAIEKLGINEDEEEEEL